MAKLCPKGKAAAKRKFKVYPSAYANMYASGKMLWKNNTRWQKEKASGGRLLVAEAQKKRQRLMRLDNGKKRIASMGKGELGRYCQQKIGWLIPEVWKIWWRKKKKLSKMRAHCESKSDVQRENVRVP